MRLSWSSQKDGAAGPDTAAGLDLPQQYRYLMLQVLAAERAELLVALADVIVVDSDQRFEFGLDLLIDGLAARVA